MCFGWDEQHVPHSLEGSRLSDDSLDSSRGLHSEQLLQFLSYFFLPPLEHNLHDASINRPFYQYQMLPTKGWCAHILPSRVPREVGYEGYQTR